MRDGRSVTVRASVIEPCDQWGPGLVLGEGGGAPIDLFLTLLK